MLCYHTFEHAVLRSIVAFRLLRILKSADFLARAGKCLDELLPVLALKQKLHIHIEVRLDVKGDEMEASVSKEHYFFLCDRSWQLRDRLGHLEQTIAHSLLDCEGLPLTELRELQTSLVYCIRDALYDARTEKVVRGSDPDKALRQAHQVFVGVLLGIGHVAMAQGRVPPAKEQTRVVHECQHELSFDNFDRLFRPVHSHELSALTRSQRLFCLPLQRRLSYQECQSAAHKP
mmetsp:Transcript_16944/g.22799  ORF Transcript_16944/g.22799 Transcript_16944/m.22799 type:complete len:232 (-) Transcript_16944:41-736(-)